MKEIFEKIAATEKAASGIPNETATSLPNEKISIKKQQFETFNNNIGVINAHGKNKRLNLMVIGAVLGLVFCLFVLTTYKSDLSGEVIGIISTISGIFGACLKDAYSFEFGSSRGSKDKDDKILNEILERLKK